jgi:uncharacterized protein (DUF1501 family)
MDALTRRRFLVASGVTGGAARAAGAAGIGIHDLLRSSAHWATPAQDKSRKLVIVTLYGGNDGLNTVIPYADPVYHSARPELAYRPEQVLRLDDALGLNPMMTGLAQLWKDKRLAIVRGVGYPDPDRSHFRSMDIWQTASPSHPVGAGWIGRWLDATKASPQTAVSFESVLPPLLVGLGRVGSCVSTDGLQLPNGITTKVLDTLSRGAPGESEFAARAAAAYSDLVTMAQLIQKTRHGSGRTAAGGPNLATTDLDGDSILGAQLAVVAGCVETGIPTRVYSVSMGGFDTHAEERSGHEYLLKQLDAALTGFVNRMARTDAGRRVTVLVYSEFGRRVAANASEGTDHGTAGPMFVLGAPVNGGFYGAQPPLSDLDSGDLRATTDFRDVFGTVLASVLDAEPARILYGYEPKLLSLFVPNR